MSYVQGSIISIIRDIKMKHQSYLTLQSDKMYRSWFKHVLKKRELAAQLRREFTLEAKQRQLELEAEPRYF